MNVSALEKATGKENKITITNEKGRLSEKDIDKLVKEAETFKAEDESIKKKIEAKNGLEHYCYTCKQQLEDAKLKEKFTEEDKKIITEKTDELLKWIE